MLIIQKYGGTSVSSVERIKVVARRVHKTVKEGHKVVVVVSAMAGETDRLIGLAGSAANEPTGRERDMLVATGEQVSSSLLALAINDLGIPAVALTASQVPIITDGVFERARILEVGTERIKRELSEGRVPVIAGFQGVDRNGEITTIGRGGSDTTAVAIAAALKADLVEIATDVDGIFTADPNVCHRTKKLDRLAYEELLEMAGAGAKVVEMRAVELAAKQGVPLLVRSSFNENPGTYVVEGSVRQRRTTLQPEPFDFAQGKLLEGSPGDPLSVSAVTYTANEAKLSIRRIPDRLGVVAQIFDPLAKANINVDMIVQATASDGLSDISFTVLKPDLKKAIQLTEVAAKKIGAGRVEAAGDVSKISIVGVGMRSHAGIAAKMFDVLAREGINVQLISTSEIKVSVVVDMKHTELAVRALHDAFVG